MKTEVEGPFCELFVCFLRLLQAALAIVIIGVAAKNVHLQHTDDLRVGPTTNIDRFTLFNGCFTTFLFLYCLIFPSISDVFCLAGLMFFFEQAQFFLWLANWIALVAKRGTETCSSGYGLVGVQDDPTCRFGKALIGLTVAIWVTFWFTSHIVVINAYAFHQYEGFDMLTPATRTGLYRRPRARDAEAALHSKEHSSGLNAVPSATAVAPVQSSQQPPQPQRSTSQQPVSSQAPVLPMPST